MSLSNSVGGYFSLELELAQQQLHPGGVYLNSGRHAFEYLLLSMRPKGVYIPAFTCPVMYDPLKKLGIEAVPYQVNERLEIADDIKLEPEQAIVYINYFGVKDRYSGDLRKKYGHNLILDLAQALFYEEDPSYPRLYSPRKFIGLPDGGIAFPSRSDASIAQTDQTSHLRTTHLIKSIDLGLEAGYEDYKKDESTIDAKDPVMKMSALTQRMFHSVDFQRVAHQRVDNFKTVHARLKDTNRLPLENTEKAIPLAYPYISNRTGLRDFLIKNKVYVPTYWPELIQSSDVPGGARQLAENITALPIDQRYTSKEMNAVVSLVEKYERGDL